MTKKDVSIKRPPIGIKPRWLIDEQRISELRKAVVRYAMHKGSRIPFEWIEEYNEIIERQKKRKK